MQRQTDWRQALPGGAGRPSHPPAAPDVSTQTRRLRPARCSLMVSLVPTPSENTNPWRTPTPFAEPYLGSVSGVTPNTLGALHACLGSKDEALNHWPE